MNQPRFLHRSIRQTTKIRQLASGHLLAQCLARFFPASHPLRGALEQAVEKVTAAQPQSPTASEHKVSEEPKDILPEVEVYIANLVVTALLAHNLDEDAAQLATLLVERIKSWNRRTLDIFSSKAFFYYSLAHERLNRLEAIRQQLLALYRTACLRRDEMGQAMLLNLLLRNYLHYNLVEQANKLVSKSNFPENASNAQFCRYLYYMGRIQAIQLDYTDAYMSLMQASRKAPQESALGFVITVHKLAIIVQLLMGDIPERQIFNQKELRVALFPYLQLTQAVRGGDLQAFNQVVERYANVFRADKTYTLIQRLGHNVIKTGLRKINISYSRISLQDIAAKLHLPNPRTAEFVCAKAIRDGVIEAYLDHENGWLTSSEVVDVYSTDEPQKAFHRRITFCLDVHNDAVKAMRYPPDAYKKELQKEKKKEDDKTDEEIVKEIEEDLEDEGL